MPTSTVEDYLKRILAEEQAAAGGELVSMGRVGAALGVAPGTVTAMMKALSDSGLVAYEPYSGVRLTQAGRQLALHVLRRHRLVELFLVKVLDLDWTEVHREAESLEHAVSDRVLAAIDDMLGHPAVDPHGDPIPDAGLRVDTNRLRSLDALEPGEEATVKRVPDGDSDLLRYLAGLRLVPGGRVTMRRSEPFDGPVTVVVEGAEHAISRELAMQIGIA